MIEIKKKFREKANIDAADIKALIKDCGSTPVEDVTVAQLYQGMRGITSIVSEISLLDPKEGIRFRGYTIPELREKLPKAEGGTEPLPEGLFYLMLIGELPTEEDVKIISKTLAERAEIPTHVYKTIDALPVSAHPMTQFVTGIMALQTESLFAKAYHDGINKKDYWDPIFEDAVNLIARVPYIAAYVYNRKYRNGAALSDDKSLDWAANFAHMLGFENEGFLKLMRLYMTIHADHEAGNVSAHATHLVGSALSDPYLSFAAGMNGLAGPLHGLANQEVIKWIFEMLKELKTDDPTKEQIAQYTKDTLAAGKVVPGYGHGVLRVTDPRFIAQMEFGKENMPDDKLVQTVWKIYEVVPEILGATGKIKNPYPNVDAHSGALLVHYGLKEYEFYTVLFGVSRALGVMTNLCWSRALGFPLERPKSITTEAVKNWLSKGAEKGKI
ncbi:citrate (Si)-synthase, eukaryotic [Arachidicoccus ginsenosidimutans]|uniref:citrate (Si)-synthase, eukaryotic n=1 Tax=Arachidicoccus sp. BS20 TaxID=1850526 RepID=UPI0007F0E734|nr:citrate (Si)-synthase, eukaryotic [Arachidicoccus sp. BS20]ANI89449.1 citrate (Si)-synthase, eukaryotic [Arachidicoccus sp. BS20]